METDINKSYAVVMRKQKLENNFFLFLPISLVDGVVSSADDSTCFVAETEKYFTFNDYAHISQDEYCVGYIIDEETLLEKYPGFSLEDAKDAFFKTVQNATCFGFYLPNLGNIAIFPFEIKRTSAPASRAAHAARRPAAPLPMIRTSVRMWVCFMNGIFLPLLYPGA